MPVGGSILPGTRIAEQWPFDPLSIWNHPVCDRARYVPARLIRRGHPCRVDLTPRLMDPSQRIVPVYHNGGQQGNRCVSDNGKVLFSMPLDENFVVPSTGQNFEFAGIDGDGLGLYGGGNFGHCTKGGIATADHGGAMGTIIDDGLPGFSGGSGLSTLGGTLTIADVLTGTPGGDGRIRHAFRINLCGTSDYYPYPPFRWPATRADNYADDTSNPNHYAGVVPACVIGSLLAIPTGITAASLGLQSQAGHDFFWTFQNYGGIPANDAGFETFEFCGELAVNDNVERAFQRRYGMAMTGKADANPWLIDMALMISVLAVIDNNTPTSIGGAGNPLQPYAPRFA